MKLICLDGKHNSEYVDLDEPSVGDSVDIGGEPYTVIEWGDELALQAEVVHD